MRDCNNKTFPLLAFFNTNGFKEAVFPSMQSNNSQKTFELMKKNVSLRYRMK